MNDEPVCIICGKPGICATLSWTPVAGDMDHLMPLALCRPHVLAILHGITAQFYAPMAAHTTRPCPASPATLLADVRHARCN
jgi:hypothetical protein